MKVTIEIDLTPEEVKNLFVPDGKTTEFTMMLYDAWADAFHQMNENLFKHPEEKNGNNKGR